jgi:hypothetical protein
MYLIFRIKIPDSPIGATNIPVSSKSPSIDALSDVRNA